MTNPRPRRFTLTSDTPLEHDIQSAILAYLAWDKRIAWAERFNSGAHVATTTDARGQQHRRFIRYAFPGCSDILGQLVDGRFLAIEVKRPGEKPTQKQSDFLSTVANNNGVAIIARSIDDVKTALDASANTNKKETANDPSPANPDQPGQPHRAA